jgi:hypothetical protein
MVSDDYLLFIEPELPATATPVVDGITRRLCAACRKATECAWANGYHECFCGALSSSSNYRLPNGECTNSLCVHYVAHHRAEVPAAQLARVGALAEGEASPTEGELQGPEKVLARVRASLKYSVDAIAGWASWGLDLDALSRGLRGGVLPIAVWRRTGQARTPARRDADDLIELLSILPVNSLPFLREAVEKDFGSFPSWAMESLRLPNWNREVWAPPLVALSRRECGTGGRRMSNLLAILGPPAVLTLVEAARSEPSDSALLLTLNWTLAAIGRKAGVSFLRQLPPNLIRISICEGCKGEDDCYCWERGICVLCRGSGLCYCRRKGSCGPDQCPRCGGTEKCYPCRGTGKRATG